MRIFRNYSSLLLTGLIVALLFRLMFPLSHDEDPLNRQLVDIGVLEVSWPNSEDTIVIYAHGNSGTRGQSNRINIYKVTIMKCESVH